jgi:membrane protease YdiL (CAAX protease family)
MEMAISQDMEEAVTADNLNEKERGKKETLHAACLFLVPILFILPFYYYSLLGERTANYVIYTIYIVGSVVITKYDRRKLDEIGISRKNLPQSVFYSLIFTFAFFAAILIRSEVQITPGLRLPKLAESILYDFAFSGAGQEIMFRGLLFFSIWRWKGVKTAFVSSTLLFGIMHVRASAIHIIRTIVIGGYYAYVTHKTRNIAGPVIAHGLHNFLIDFLFISSQ